MTSSPPAKETIYSTLHPKRGMHSWYLLAEGQGGVLGNLPGRQWGQGRLCGGADRVIFCEAGMLEELFIVDGLPACRRSCTMERRKSK